MYVNVNKTVTEKTDLLCFVKLCLLTKFDKFVVYILGGTPESLWVLSDKVHDAHLHYTCNTRMFY